MRLERDKTGLDSSKQGETWLDKAGMLHTSREMEVVFLSRDLLKETTRRHFFAAAKKLLRHCWCCLAEHHTLTATATVLVSLP